MRVEFQAPEYHADGSFRPATYSFEGSLDGGWAVAREGKRELELGAGYRLLESAACGICATDLARRYLPFPLPQIIGHEVLAVDDSGQRFVVEINASHLARGLETDCPFCRAGLVTHCPERVTLGIDRLPGGFGPYILAPVGAVIPVPDAIPSAAAVLVEPLAAALHAVTTVSPKPGESVAVLGPRRLGMLVIAALSAFRNRARGPENDDAFTILALARRQEMLDLAMELGADRGLLVGDSGDDLLSGLADVVIDTTGTPEGLDLAVRIAGREVHLKSTHGRGAGGLEHLTELVVDELRIGRFNESDVDLGDATVAWLASTEVPADLEANRMLRGEPRAMLAELESRPSASGLPRADVAVVDTVKQIDRAIRPRPDREIPLVKPGGAILVRKSTRAGGASPLVEAIVNRGLNLTSSRCGDFEQALALMLADPELARVGERLITHRFPTRAIAEAFEIAASPACIKAVIDVQGGS